MQVEIASDFRAVDRYLMTPYLEIQPAKFFSLFGKFLQNYKRRNILPSSCFFTIQTIVYFVKFFLSCLLRPYTR